MIRTYPSTHYLLGLTGLALLRTWAVGDPAAAAMRVAEAVDLARRLDDAQSATVRFDEVTPDNGYAYWADRYATDQPNVLVSMVDSALEELMPPAGERAGRWVDLGCGTGRTVGALRDRGHDVLGVDASPAMLRVARSRHPGAAFALGRIERLPLQDRSVDVATCQLVLAHVADLRPALAEIARVLRIGGRALLCDPHPTFVCLGGHAMVPRGPRHVAVMRNVVHPLSTYLAIFAAAGLAVEACVEPVLTETAVATMAAARTLPEAALAAFAGLPALVGWRVRRVGVLPGATSPERAAEVWTGLTTGEEGR